MGERQLEEVVGRWVVLMGLKGAAHLNGRMGLAKKVDRSTTGDRLVVQLDPREKLVKVSKLTVPAGRIRVMQITVTNTV